MLSTVLAAEMPLTHREMSLAWPLNRVQSVASKSHVEADHDPYIRRTILHLLGSLADVEDNTITVPHAMRDAILPRPWQSFPDSFDALALASFFGREAVVQFL